MTVKVGTFVISQKINSSYELKVKKKLSPTLDNKLFIDYEYCEFKFKMV